MTEADAREQAMAALRRDDLATALAAYAGVLAAAPVDVEALLNCAVIHGRSGNPDEAGRLLERVLALAPDHPIAHANLAKLALDGHDWKRAEAAARRAVQLAPAMASGHGNLAVALKKQGNWDEAAAIVEAGLARCPGDSALMMLEGELRQRVGDISGAIAAYRRAAPTPANLSSLVAAHNYSTEPTREECFALHRVWAASPGGRSRLQGWRASLRGTMAARPLCRPEVFVPALEQAYRQMADLRRAAIG